jgi:8-oxo-dGTP diphosphatase
MYNNIAVKGIILNFDKILILEKKYNQNESIWDLAGGLVENYETEIETLTREIKEELNIDIDIIRNVGVWHFTRHYDKKLVTATNYLCKPKQEVVNIKLSSEHNSYLWIKPQEIINYKVKDKSLVDNILKTFEELTE